MFKPWHRSVILPTVDVLDAATLDSWLVVENVYLFVVIVFFIIFDSEFQILLNKVFCHGISVFKLETFVVLSLISVLIDHKNTNFSQNWPQVVLKCFYKVEFVKVQNLVNHIFQKHAW